MRKSLTLCLLGLALAAALPAQTLMLRSIDVKANLKGKYSFGVGATLQLVDELDFAPSASYYVRKGKNAWGADADLHLNFWPMPTWALYPLAGITYWQCGHGRFGSNLGVGCRFFLDSEWAVTTEWKYKILKHWDGHFLSVGLSYRF